MTGAAFVLLGLRTRGGLASQNDDIFRTVPSRAAKMFTVCTECGKRKALEARASAPIHDHGRLAGAVRFLSDEGQMFPVRAELQRREVFRVLSSSEPRHRKRDLLIVQNNAAFLHALV